MKKTLILSSLLLFLGSQAHSALTIHIDVPTETITVTGSFSGVQGPSDARPFFISNQTSLSGHSPANWVYFSSDMATGGDMGGMLFQAGEDNKVFVQVYTRPEPYIPFTITGTGVAGSYGIYGSEIATAINKLTAMELTHVLQGTSGDTITITVNPIPEPSTYAAIAGAGLLALVAVRHLRRRA